MRCVCLLFPLLIPAALSAEPRARWSSEDLFQSVSTSLALGYGDTVIAGQLQKVDLTERLADEPIELLKRQGACAIGRRDAIKAVAASWRVCRRASASRAHGPMTGLKPEGRSQVRFIESGLRSPFL